MQIFGIEVDQSIGLPLFFLIGLYIALSPCLFPIMPLTIFRIMKGSLQEEGTEQPRRKLSLLWVLLLVGGIISAFYLATIIWLYVWSEFGQFLIQMYRPLTYLLGFILILMGVLLLIPSLAKKVYSRIRIPSRLTDAMQKEKYRYLDLYLLGFGYSIIALPCAFPAFIILLTMIVTISNMFYSMIGLALFALGLFIPYFILVMITSEAGSLITIINKNYRGLEMVLGILVLIFGFLFIWPAFGGPTLFSLG